MTGGCPIIDEHSTQTTPRKWADASPSRLSRVAIRMGWQRRRVPVPDEYEEIEPGNQPDDAGEFRRMMAGVDREGILRMIARLTGDIQANPQETEALSARGWLYGELGDYHRAVEDNSRVIELDPENSEAFLNRAHAYSELKEFHAAIRDYDAAIRLSPGQAIAHYGRGACHAELGNLGGAVSDFDVAVLLAPDDASPYYNRGLTYGELGNHLQAVEDLSRAIELEPDLPEAHYFRGG